MKGTWSTQTIAGHSADVYEPAGGTPARFAVLYLHDLDGASLRDRPAFTRWFDELMLACVCPEAGPCWWSDRLCADFDSAVPPERYLREQVVPYMEKRWQAGPRGLAVLGIGMGGQAALKLAFKYPDRFPVTAGIAAALDYHELYGQGTRLDDLYDSREQCRQDTAVLHVHPSHSPPHIFFCVDPDDALWFRGNDRLHEKLNALGIAHAADLTTRAGGHSWEFYNRVAERVVRFVHAGLEQESRRLL